MKKVIYISSLLMVLAAPLTANAEPDAYCSGPGCADSAAMTGASSTQASTVPLPPTNFMLWANLIWTLDKLAQSYPDQTVSRDAFSGGGQMQLELYETVNLLLFLDPYTFNRGLQPSDYAPLAGGATGEPAGAGNSSDTPQTPFSFDYMTAADYRGHLDMMLDQLIERYPERTISADQLPSSQTVPIGMNSVANLLIFLDPHLDNLGWSPDVFESDE